MQHLKMHHFTLKLFVTHCLIKYSRFLRSYCGSQEASDSGRTAECEETQGHRDNNGPCLYSHQMATAWLTVSSILGPLVPIFN